MNAILLSSTGKLSRTELQTIPAPLATATHRPISHHEIVQALIETLAFRHIGVVRDEYAVSRDGMKLFGVLELTTGMEGLRFAVGLRNANDKSMRLALTVGYRVLVCDNMMFAGDFTPVLAKHSKHFSLVDALAVGVDRMQRNFVPLRRQIEIWRARQISDEAAKLLIYRAFVEDELDAPKHLAKLVHAHYFQPQHEAFYPRTLWSLSNAFTAALRTLDPIPQFRATARLGTFLEGAPLSFVRDGNPAESAVRPPMNGTPDTFDRPASVQ